MLLFLLFYEGDLTNIMHNNWSPCLNKVKLFLKNLRFRLASTVWRLLKGWWRPSWPWTRKRLPVCADYSTCMKALSPVSIIWRLRSYCTRCAYMMHTRDSSSLWAARGHFVSSTIRPLNSASQPPSIDKGESHKGLPILAFTNELSFRKLRRVYLVVERSLDLTFDLSSIFRGAIWPGGLLFFRPLQIRRDCISSIKRIQLFLRRERLHLFIII